jgi:uncharacterized OB-fold protein
MLPTNRKSHGIPTTEVEGDFGVHFHYTAGLANEKFFYGLKDQKLLANTCDNCNFTYLPPKFFCEDCFAELGEEGYKEVGPGAELFSFSKVYVDKTGKRLTDPYFIGLVQVDGTNTKFFHRLVDISEPKMGMKLKPVWETERKGSLLDLKGFTA